MTDFLVTGTDTGIGKTVIAAALVRALRTRGVRALGFKPVETGLEEGQPSDSEILARASLEKLPLAAPLLTLTEPLAPAVAAERGGLAIDPTEINARITSLRAAGYTLVVEGAGGVFAPLAWCVEKGPYPFFTVMDLAERCRLEAIVVARAGLGTLNHAVLTVEALRSRHIPVRAVILNGRHRGSPADTDAAEATNPSTLARMLPDVLIIEVPQHTTPDAIEASVPYVNKLIGGS